MTSLSRTIATFAALAALAATFASCGITEHHKPPTTTALEPYECGTVTRLHTFDGIFLASQPKPADLEQAKMGGIKTVINVRHDKELEFDERTVVTQLGLDYVQLPWNGPDELTDEVFDRGRELLSTTERPFMMHCKSANRVGAMWLVWRVLDGGLSFDAALAEARMVGVKTPAYITRAKEYLARRAGE